MTKARRKKLLKAIYDISNESSVDFHVMAEGLSELLDRCPDTTLAEIIEMAKTEHDQLWSEIGQMLKKHAA